MSNVLPFYIENKRLLLKTPYDLFIGFAALGENIKLLFILGSGEISPGNTHIWLEACTQAMYNGHFDTYRFLYGIFLDWVNSNSNL